MGGEPSDDSHALLQCTNNVPILIKFEQRGLEESLEELFMADQGRITPRYPDYVLTVIRTLSQWLVPYALTSATDMP